MRMAVLGAGVGFVGAIFLLRFLTASMPGLATNNTVAIAGASALLVAIAAVSCWLPARRAAKVNPTVALRAE
jgi:ABC-type antimicrobial peptide transport system permease subunit